MKTRQIVNSQKIQNKNLKEKTRQIIKGKKFKRNKKFQNSYLALI